jgi:hypothetical protein
MESKRRRLFTPAVRSVAAIVAIVLGIVLVSVYYPPAFVISTTRSSASAITSSSSGSTMTETAIPSELCTQEGLVACGEQLSSIVTKTPQFIAAENGTQYSFQANQSGVGSNGKETNFGLVYVAFSGKILFPGCAQIVGQIQVAVPLTNGSYDTAAMTISKPPLLYCGNGNGPAPGG